MLDKILGYIEDHLWAGILVGFLFCGSLIILADWLWGLIKGC